MMRILSGIYRGKQLDTPEYNKNHNIRTTGDTEEGEYQIRPTQEKIRNGIFSSIGEDIYDSVFIDVFAGTGAMGIEALSRGAKFAYFVDIDTTYTIQNLQSIGVPARQYIVQQVDYRNLDWSAVKASLVKQLKPLNPEEGVAHQIFLDPPYLRHDIITTLQNIYNSKILLPSGHIYIEDSSKLDEVELFSQYDLQHGTKKRKKFEEIENILDLQGLNFIKIYKHGDTKVFKFSYTGV